MKIFFIKILILFVSSLISILIIFSMIDGYADPFYLRFTTPKQTSLIIGTSRAAQGLHPEVINRVLGRYDIYNYSFSITHSPFGPTYLNSIKRKLNAENYKGIFILAVDPWSLCSRNQNPNDLIAFEESKLSLATTKIVDSKPNYDYLINSVQDPYYKLILKTRIFLPLYRKYNDLDMFLHDDGWLEVTSDMDSVSMNKNVLKKIEFYKKRNLPFYKFSSLRLEYFQMTLNYLKNYGDVFIVRLPVHPQVMEMDETLISEFSGMIENIAKSEGVEFLDLSTMNDKFLYTDGNHLDKNSGAEVSEIVANWIDNLIKTRSF